RLILLLVIWPEEHIQRGDGWCVEFLVTILRGHQTCPAAGSVPACLDRAPQYRMIDPPKATKGRRMSKKTRKKSPNTSSGKPVRGQSIGSAKTAASKIRRAAASKVDNKAGKRAHNASPKASHKAPSKQLKPSAPRDSALAKTEAGTPLAKKKPLTGKADAAAV